MMLFFHTWVVEAVVVISTINIASSDYIQQPNNDKNPLLYEYKHIGYAYGQAEVREGEHDNGRYYVNSKRSFPDVKNTTDEWDYYPLYQYDSSYNHTNSTTTSSNNWNTVVNMTNKNITQRIIDSSQPGNKIQFIQSVQPHHRISQNTEETDVLFVSRNESWVTNCSSIGIINPDISLQLNSNSASVDSLNKNSVNDVPQQKLNGEISLPSKKNYNGKDYKLSTMHHESNLILSSDNNLPSTIAEEGQLFIDKIGRFRQRLYLQSQDALISSSSISTISPVFTREIPLSFSTIQDEQYFNGSMHKKNNKAYLSNRIPELSIYSSNKFPLLKTNVTASSSKFENAQNHDNSNIENLELEAYSTFTNRVIESNFGTTRNPLTNNYGSQNFSSSLLKDMSLTTVEKKEYGFKKPIVVLDVPKQSPFQYSTIFECDNTIISTPHPILLMKGFSEDKTSWYILNPIHAGISLVNTEKTYLIVNDTTRNKKLPTNVIEKIQKTSQLNTLSQENNYLENHTALQNNIIETDQIVEIHKSVEINKNNTKNNTQNLDQSIVSPQIKNISHPYLKIIQKDSQQQPHFTNGIELNSKQIYSNRSCNETLIKVYELSDIYPRDLSDENSIYVIPSKTYIMENSSNLDNSSLKTTFQQYQENICRTDSKIKPKEHQIQIEAENIAHTKPLPNLDASAPYNTKILHKQPQIIPLKLENNSEISPQRSLHIFQIPTTEKIIQKKVPYQIQKVIEKNILIPQNNLIPVQIPFQQLIPIYSEKVAEEKIPVPLQVPISQSSLFGKQIRSPVTIENLLERPVHIPITAEKIIKKKVPLSQVYPVEIGKIVERNTAYPIDMPKYAEKPVTVQAPSGIQYGVNYQQIMKPQNHVLYFLQSNKFAPLYALPISSKKSFRSNNNNITKSMNDVNVINVNHNQSFQGYIYEKPKIPFNEEKEQNIEKRQFLNSKMATKIFTYDSYIPKYSLSNAVLHRRHNDMQHLNKPERHAYIGSVSVPQDAQKQYRFQSNAFLSYPLKVDKTLNSRKLRIYEPIRYQKGNFRQSKVEYGFKPPLVPSIQYDEETASKVES